MKRRALIAGIAASLPPRNNRGDANETSPQNFSASDSGHCRSSGPDAPCTRADLPQPIRAIGHAVPAAAAPAIPVARVIANRLSEVWGQQVVVENRGGAAGNIAAQVVAQAEPDGHTLFLGSIFLATNPFLFSSVGYDPIADLAPITRSVRLPI